MSKVKPICIILPRTALLHILLDTEDRLKLHSPSPAADGQLLPKRQ